MMNDTSLTDEKFWNEYWENVSLPSEIKRTEGELLINILLDTFDKHLPKSFMHVSQVSSGRSADFQDCTSF